MRSEMRNTFSLESAFYRMRCTYEELTPWSSMNTDAVSLKLRYACSNPVSRVRSSTIRMIIEISR